MPVSKPTPRPHACIAAISLPLDDAGNSVNAQKAIADMSNALGGNPYKVQAK